MALIPDLPEPERPRERLARLGPAALSDAELLAIFLRTGVQGSSAIEVGRGLLEKFGSLNSIGAQSAELLAREHGLGPAKAAQLLAAFELGARCAKERSVGTPMTSSLKIYQSLAPRIAHLAAEQVLLVLLDVKLRIKQVIELAEGDSQTVICKPSDVLHHVLLHRAKTFVICHNHPSGDPTPSRADNTFTTKMDALSMELGLKLLDHIIVGRPNDAYPQGFYSYNEENLLNSSNL